MTSKSTPAVTLCWCSLLVCLLCLGGTASAEKPPPHRRRMPTGAFLRRPAATTQALDHQLAADSVVRLRYARLFQMPPQMVQTAMRQMRLSRLRQDRILEVFYVHPGEHIGYRLRRVRKGTWVYALPDGTPLLAWVCGNPLRKVLSARRTAPQTKLAANIPDFQPYEESPAYTPTAKTAALRNALPPDFVEVALPPVQEFPPVAPVVAGSHLSNWANAIGLIGLVGLVSGSSGGSPPPNPPPGPPPVPENRTMILLVTGTATGLLLFTVYRRTRPV